MPPEIKAGPRHPADDEPRKDDRLIGGTIYTTDNEVDSRAQVVRRGGRRSRDKGNRSERALVRFLQDRGFAAERVPLSGAAGGRYVGDISIPVIGRDLIAEVKVRGTGFRQLYAWLAEKHLLIIRADRCEPLVVLPLQLAAEIAGLAEKARCRE